MRTLFLILFLPFITFSQHEIQFSDDLKIDPYDYKLTGSKIKEVVQYHVYNRNWHDSTAADDQTMTLDYVINYDTNGRIVSYKYDFKRHFMSMNPNDKNVDSLRLAMAKKEDGIYMLQHDTLLDYFNFHEYEFIYEGSTLVRIEHHDPFYRFFGVLDGVYIKERNFTEACFYYEYDENGNLIKETFVNGEGESYSSTWEYETFHTQRKSFGNLKLEPWDIDLVVTYTPSMKPPYAYKFRYTFYE